MKIAIIGYGKMGKMVEAKAKARKHEVVSIIDTEASEATSKEISKEGLGEAEVAIDFTHPRVVVDNIEKLAQAGVNIVVGTTGWYENLDRVKKIVEEHGVGLLYAGNFSIGVNTFYKIVEEAAKLLTGKDYDVAIHETHHNQKADAPSGTAKEIAQTILANFKEKKAIMNDNEIQPIPGEKLQISASRVGKVVGIHEVKFDGFSDSITLIHEGKNREGYALGSILASEWLGKKKGVFSPKDWMGN